MGRIFSFISTMASLIVAIVTGALIGGDGPNKVDISQGRKTLKVIKKFDWYKAFKSQYSQSWDFHPIILDFLSHVNVDELETEAGRAKFLTNFKIQLDVMRWK